MSTIENIVKSLAYATEHNQGLHLTHEEVPALNACIAQLEAEIRNWQDCYCEFETIAPDGKLKISVLDIYNRIAELNARIAELEERLGLCESALVSMTYQFFYSSKSGALVHSFMSAEEEAAEYLVDYGIARWENEHKNSIVFEEVQE